MSSFGTSHHNTPGYRIQEMNAPQNVLQTICSGKVVLLQDHTRRNETMYLTRVDGKVKLQFRLWFQILNS